MAESIHIGRKIGCIWELRGIKQEYLVSELGVSSSLFPGLSKAKP
jgi:hypothetical protein